MSALRFAAALFLALPCAVAAQAPAARATPAADAAFAATDTNHDGTLSRDEFRVGHAALLRAIAVEARLRDQFRTVDADRSGALEANEYAGLVLVKRAGKAAPAFAAFDRDGDAKLGFAEYLVAVRTLAAATAAAGG